MKMKVIFIQYCILATIGFSEMKLFVSSAIALETWSCAGGNAREDLPLQGEGQRKDEEHEEQHLQHQEDKDLSISISMCFQATGYSFQLGTARTRV